MRCAVPDNANQDLLGKKDSKTFRFQSLRLYSHEKAWEHFIICPNSKRFLIEFHNLAEVVWKLSSAKVEICVFSPIPWPKIEKSSGNSTGILTKNTKIFKTLFWPKEHVSGVNFALGSPKTRKIAFFDSHGLCKIPWHGISKGNQAENQHLDFQKSIFWQKIDILFFGSPLFSALKSDIFRLFWSLKKLQKC